MKERARQGLLNEVDSILANREIYTEGEKFLLKLN